MTKKFPMKRKKKIIPDSNIIKSIRAYNLLLYKLKNPILQIIPSNQIDKAKWDNCIANNSNGLIYATTAFLDAMAIHWEGCIINDYEAIFPLCIKQKFGIQYLYTPPFIQQLGFIGNNELVSEKVIAAIFEKVKYGSVNLNFSNTNFNTMQQYKVHNNYVIDLNQNYQQIKANYKKSIDYSLSKALKQNLRYTTDLTFETAVENYQKHNQQVLQHVTLTDYKNLEKVLTLLQQEEKIIVRKVVNDTNETLSIAILLKDNKRYYYLTDYTNNEGRQAEANYFLYDKLLEELAENHMLFDFEGSDLPGVKSFYEKFGAVNQPYFYWHFNQLPFFLKWIKK